MSPELKHTLSTRTLSSYLCILVFVLCFSRKTDLNSIEVKHVVLKVLFSFLSDLHLKGQISYEIDCLI